MRLPTDSNIREKEHEKIEKHQRLRKELGKMWTVKAAVVLLVVGTLLKHLFVPFLVKSHSASFLKLARV